MLTERHDDVKTVRGLEDSVLRREEETVFLHSYLLGLDLVYRGIDFGGWDGPSSVLPYVGTACDMGLMRNTDVQRVADSVVLPSEECRSDVTYLSNVVMAYHKLTEDGSRLYRQLRDSLQTVKVQSEGYPGYASVSASLFATLGIAGSTLVPLLFPEYPLSGLSAGFLATAAGSYGVYRIARWGGRRIAGRRAPRAQNRMAEITNAREQQFLGSLETFIGLTEDLPDDPPIRKGTGILYRPGEYDRFRKQVGWARKAKSCRMHVDDEEVLPFVHALEGYRRLWGDNYLAGFKEG